MAINREYHKEYTFKDELNILSAFNVYSRT